MQSKYPATPGLRPNTGTYRVPFALDDAVAASFRNLWGLLLIPLSFEAADCPRPEQNCGKRYYRQALRHGSRKFQESLYPRRVLVLSRQAWKGPAGGGRRVTCGRAAGGGRGCVGSARRRRFCGHYSQAASGGDPVGLLGRFGSGARVLARSRGTPAGRNGRWLEGPLPRAPSANPSESESARRGH